MLFDVCLHQAEEESKGTLHHLSPIKMHARPGVGDTIHYQDKCTKNENWWEVIHVTLCGDSIHENYPNASIGIIHVIQYDGLFITHE
jgi:hypothetical protein